MGLFLFDNLFICILVCILYIWLLVNLLSSMFFICIEKWWFFNRFLQILVFLFFNNIWFCLILLKGSFIFFLTHHASIFFLTHHASIFLSTNSRISLFFLREWLTFISVFHYDFFVKRIKNDIEILDALLLILQLL